MLKSSFSDQKPPHHSTFRPQLMTACTSKELFSHGLGERGPLGGEKATRSWDVSSAYSGADPGAGASPEALSLQE